MSSPSAESDNADPAPKRMAKDATQPIGAPVRAAAEASAVDTANPFPWMAPPQQAGEMGRLANYRILKLLGEGGNGSVFQAQDMRLQRFVALKVMNAEVAKQPNERQRFLREARAAASLKSDHIIVIYEVNQENDVPYLAMELLHGQPLDRRIYREPPLTLAEAVRIGREVAQALVCAHGAGLIHRDIKPANIWLESTTGRIKVLDFGLARAVKENVQLTRKGFVVGTPSFMSPEQARSEELDTRCDIFSLGCVLYRLTAGRLPFQGDTLMALLTSLAVDTPPDVRELNRSVPPALGMLINSMISRDRASRPGSALEVMDALDHVEQNLGTVAIPLPKRSRSVPDQMNTSADVPRLAAPAARRAEDTPVASARLPVRSRKRPWVIAGFVFAGLLAGIGYMLFPGNKPKPLPSPSQPVDVAVDDKPDEQKEWIKQFESLDSVDAKLKAFTARLKLRNPDFDGNVTVLDSKGNRILGLAIRRTEGVNDLSPVQAFPDLKILELHGGAKRVKPLDLSPIHGLPLHMLHLDFNAVVDLKPLQSMPLEQLIGHKDAITDLTPLSNLHKLRILDISATHIRDLSPLKGLQLVSLNGTGSADSLVPLEGMPLETLIVDESITDLSPLRGMKLKWFEYGDGVKNITVLRDMPLERIGCSTFRRERDEAVWKSIPTLKTINNMPAEDFWKTLPDGK